MIRLPTVAANADILGEDTPLAEPQERADTAPAAGTRRDPRVRRQRADDAPRGEATPGQDINAPGFVKDPDSAKPT